MLFSRQKPGAVEYIVAGLGNPGSKYENTRHNCGFITLDAIAEKYGVRVDRLKWNALTGDGMIGDKRVLLMKPQTFMNNSGEAVTAAMRFYKLPPENVIVILDDVNLDLGVMRIRRKGSDGGQKGMRSIIELSGSDQFPRIKIGAGKKPHPDYDLVEWVLSRFTDSERKTLGETAASAAEAVELMVNDKFEQAMNKFSR